ncbi:MAG: hypothetical protein LBE17_09735 [Treponema sp.]|jgi:hypothetical protein|nr:hypothetical protein [Treponema sp.]
MIGKSMIVKSTIVKSMKNSNTVFPGKVPAGAVFDDRGLTLAETLPAIAVVTLLLSLILPLLSGVTTNTARSRETLIFLRDFLVFDKTIRDKAGKVVIPYWERTVTVSDFSRGGRDLAGAVLEIPYYGGAREGFLRLSVDRENRLVLESGGGGEGPEYCRAPKALTVRNVEVFRDDEGRPLALKLNFEYRNESFYTLAPFAAFPVKRGFYG